MRNGLKIPESQQDLDDHSEEKDVIVNSQLKRFLGTSNNTRSKSYIKTGGFKKLTENSNEDESHDKGRELACNNIQEALEPSKEKLLNSSRYELSSQEQAEYLKKYGHLYTDVKKSSTSLAQVGRKSRLQIETNQEPLEGSLNSSRNDSVNVFEQLSPKNKSARRSIIAFKNINPINIEKAASSRNDHLRRRNTEIPVRINLAADNLTVSEFQSNMTEIRNKLKNYEKGVDDINAKLDIGSVEKIKALTKKVIDLNTELRLKEEEKLQMKQLMSDGLRIKEEECQAKIIEVKGLHLEELTKLKQQSESKLTSKRICWEEENSSLRRQLEELQESTERRVMSDSKKHAAELEEFQRKYSEEILALQENFKDFKAKAYGEFKKLKEAREQESAKVKELQSVLKRYKREFEMNESSMKENETFFQSKVETVKRLIKTNEILKIELENSKKEIEYLKYQVKKLESSEKRLQHILLENDYINERVQTMGFDVRQSSPDIKKASRTPVLGPRAQKFDQSIFSEKLNLASQMRKSSDSPMHNYQDSQGQIYLRDLYSKDPFDGPEDFTNRVYQKKDVLDSKRFSTNAMVGNQTYHDFFEENLFSSAEQFDFNDGPIDKSPLTLPRNVKKSSRSELPSQRVKHK